MLASWTHLRHDTILYAKQSYTSNASCSDPAGFVEPVPHVWGRMEKMVQRAAEIAGKQLEQKELTGAETKFLEDIVQIHRGSGKPWYNGWYPGLFYKGRDESGKDDALVADVHTDVPSLKDPGCVLHQGVGKVDMMLIAIDNGKDRMVYAGPVLSHYAFRLASRCTPS